MGHSNTDHSDDDIDWMAEIMAELPSNGNPYHYVGMDGGEEEQWSNLLPDFFVASDMQLMFEVPDLSLEEQASLAFALLAPPMEEKPIEWSQTDLQMQSPAPKQHDQETKRLEQLHREEELRAKIHAEWDKEGVISEGEMQKKESEFQKNPLLLKEYTDSLIWILRHQDAKTILEVHAKFIIKHVEKLNSNFYESSENRKICHTFFSNLLSSKCYELKKQSECTGAIKSLINYYKENDFKRYQLHLTKLCQYKYMRVSLTAFVDFIEIHLLHVKALADKEIDSDIKKQFYQSLISKISNWPKKILKLSPAIQDIVGIKITNTQKEKIKSPDNKGKKKSSKKSKKKSSKKSKKKSKKVNKKKHKKHHKKKVSHKCKQPEPVSLASDIEHRLRMTEQILNQYQKEKLQIVPEWPSRPSDEIQIIPEWPSPPPKITHQTELEKSISQVQHCPEIEKPRDQAQDQVQEVQDKAREVQNQEQERAKRLRLANDNGSQRWMFLYEMPAHKNIWENEPDQLVKHALFAQSPVLIQPRSTPSMQTNIVPSRQAMTLFAPSLDYIPHRWSCYKYMAMVDVPVMLLKRFKEEIYKKLASASRVPDGCDFTPYVAAAIFDNKLVIYLIKQPPLRHTLESILLLIGFDDRQRDKYKMMSDEDSMKILNAVYQDSVLKLNAHTRPYVP